MEYRRERRAGARKDDMPAIIGSDQDSEKLFTVLCNYLSLAQFELARSVLDELFLLSPEKVARVLRGLVLADIPASWLFSESVPSGAHLAWLALVEYTSLFERVQNRGTDEQAHRREWSALAKKMDKTPINPLGFLSHSRFGLEVLEATRLLLPPDFDKFERGLALGFQVQVECEGQEASTSLTEMTDHPDWSSSDSAFPFRALYADSKVRLKVYALRRHTPAYADYLGGEPASQQLVGVCSLPLHQLRQKELYHIWIPLEPPPPEDGKVSENPFRLGSARNAGLAQVAKSNFGKVRVRFRWTQGASNLAGRFSPRTVNALETDLLIANAIYNGRKAYYARIKGDMDAIPTYNGMDIELLRNRSNKKKKTAAGDDLDDDDLDEDDEDEDAAAASLPQRTPLYNGVLNDETIDGRQVSSNAPLLTESAVLRIREYCFWLLSDSNASEKRNPLVRLARDKHGLDEFLPADVLQQLRVVIRALPPAAHALCSRMANLARECELSREYHLHELESPSRFAALYASSIAEMLLNDEFAKASLTLHHLTHDIENRPVQSPLVDDVLTGVVSYVHDHHKQPDKPDRTLRSMLSKYAAEAGIKPGKPKPAGAHAAELSLFSNEQLIRRHQDVLLMQAQAYSALLGTDQEYSLRRFCALEDAYAHGSQHQRRKLPLCFVTLHTALDRLDRLPSLTPAERLGQQRLSLSAFFTEYYAYIRVTQQHVFQYAVKKALGFAKARNWKEANVVLRPLSQLRPLVVLIAWDEFDDDFHARQNLIVNLWRNRPSFPPDECSEPRLTQWCNRLDFNVRLINAVLAHFHPDATTSEENDKAIRLLDTLRLHSILYAFRDYLPALPPSVLLRLLDPKLQGLVLSADRGPECDHDLHVLRSYYAIRCVLGVMLGDLDDPAFEAVAAANADNEFALTDDDASRQGRQQRDASTDAGGSDSDEAKADEASDAESAAPSASAAQPKKVTPLDAARLYVLGMSKDEFQVTTLEKMFCLLFLLEDDLEERDADDSSSDEAHGGAQGFRRGQVVSDRARAAYESLKNDADLSLAESMDSTTRAFLQAPEHVESPMVVDTVQCQSLLFFMREVTLLVMKGMANPSHHNRNFMRLAALRQHIEEGIWRLSIIAESDDNPRIEDMVAPLEVISVKFLKLDLTAEAALPDAPLTLTPQQRNRLARLDNVFVAERWLQLCALVRDKTRSKKRGRRSKKASAEVVDAVIKFIRDFYQDPRAAVNTNPMQGFFFAMDVAITFSHVFTKKAYEQLMDYAIAFLQATKASHTTREAIELYNYYMAYAKHCRNNNRSKFRLAEAYEAIAASGAKDAPDLGSGIPSSQLAKRQKKKKRRGKKGGRRGDDSDDDLDDAAGATGAARRGADDDEPNALIHWVQAYRLTRRMRLGQLPPDESPVAPERKPPMPSLASALGQEDSAEAVQREREGTVHAAAAVRGGWLSAVTPADQDRIPSRPYVPYVERYEEYCEHMGIRSISDDLSDAAYRLIVDARLQHHAAEAGHGAYSDSDVSSEDSEGGGRRKTGGGPRADAVFDADDPERQSPWEGLAVIDYLSRVAHAAARTEAQLTPLPATATLHQRLVRVSERAALLGKKLLPSLGVIRYSMRHADEENIKALAERARTQSAFLPTYARWISSRTRMYEEMLDVLVRNEDGDLVLPDNIRDLLAFEDTYHDQKAHVVLLQMLLRQSSTLSLADKKKALALADRCINANPETQPEAESAVQQLLLSIIEDERHGDSVLRAHCVMRLKDTAWAAQMCAKYVDEWEDHDLAMSVLFKCLSDLKPAHPLRPRIAFKYNMILIFQHLTSACDAEQARAYLDRREADDPDMGRDEAVRVMKMFRTWRGFEAQCREHLAYVLITLLDMKQVEAAQDLFELYVKTRGSPHIGMELDPTMSDMVTDLIEAAAISRFLRPGCPMKERIEGVRRLRKLPEEKTFFIARALVGHLVDSRSRYLVLEYLNRFIEDQRATAALHPNSAPPEALSRITDEDMEWMNVMRVATQMLVNIPEDIERRVSRFYRSPKRIAMALLRLGHVQHMTRVLKFFKHYHGKELDHRDRIVDVRPGAPAPTTTASAAAPSSANGGAAAGSSGAAPDVVADESGAGALAATLDPARFNPSAYILEFAFEVLTLEHADMGKDTGFACFDMVFEEQKRQREDAASRRKKAARKGAKEPIEVRKTQEIADRVDEKVLVALVATTCINAVNALSAKLGHHEHALFVVHLMKTVLTYFKGKLEPRLEKEDLTEFNTWRSVRTMQTHQRVKPVMANLNRAIKAILKRYKQYRELVFTPQELAQIDGTDPAGVAGQDMPLLYSLRRVRFNLDDLCDPIRAQDLRHRLVDLDKIELARRVWVEAEKKDPDDFEREISSKVADVEEMCKKFAAQVGDA